MHELMVAMTAGMSPVQAQARVSIAWRAEMGMNEVLLLAKEPLATAV